MAYDSDSMEDLVQALGQDAAGGASDENGSFGQSLPQQITGVLAGEIIERELPAGTKLPELALAERFGTSRAPIREALYLLTQEGLVERKPRRGAVVRDYGRQEIEELYRVRTLLERLALERVCGDQHTREACVAALEPIARQMDGAERDVKRYHELNFSFHKNIIVFSGSHLLQRLYARIEGPLKVVLRQSFSTEGAVPKSFGEHLQLLSAVSEADVEKACNILLTHDDDGMHRALEAVSSAQHGS